MRAYTSIIEYFKARGLKPKFHTVNNECPKGLKEYVNKEKIDLQLIPPHYHCNNPAEKATGTWKEHLIAGIYSADPNFPLYLWDQIISQCTTTLILLRPSNINPHLSTEAQLNGAFNYNKNPMEPPGTKV